MIYVKVFVYACGEGDIYLYIHDYVEHEDWFLPVLDWLLMPQCGVNIVVYTKQWCSYATSGLNQS
jgi:hypothetical protein